MSRFWWMALTAALIAAMSMVWACGGDDDDDDDNDDGGDDDDDDDVDDDDDDMADDDMSDDDMDDDMDDDADDDTAEGCDPVGGELVTICNPVFPSEVEYELSVNGWPMAIMVNFEGTIDATYDMWFDCRPTEEWPNKLNLDGFGGQTIGIIPWNLVLAYHQTPPGFTGLTDVNPTCELVMVDADQIAVSNTLDIAFTVKAGGPTK